MASSDEEHLQDLLEQSSIAWGEVSLKVLPRERKELFLALIISKNPPLDVIQGLVTDYVHADIEGDDESFVRGFSWSTRLYNALAKPNVDVEVMRVYFRVLQKECHLIHFRKIEAGRLSPRKLQCLLAFLSSAAPHMAKTCTMQLLRGEDPYSFRTARLWNACDEESWERLQAIVQGMDGSNTSTFLARYLDIVLECCCEPRDKEHHLASFADTGSDERSNSRDLLNGQLVEEALSRSKWANHLELVAIFAPHLFMEHNQSTGDVFLNSILTFEHGYVVYGSYSNKHMDMIRAVLQHCIESIYVPNVQGRTPLGHCLQNMVVSGENPGQQSYLSNDYLYFCLDIAKVLPSALTSGTIKDSAELPPFIVFVERFVTLLTHRNHAPAKQMAAIKKILDVFLDQVTDDCCYKILDPFGNTALHVAIASCRKSPEWSQSLIKRLIKRLATRQAALVRNNEGKLPIDVTLKQKKESWIIVTLCKAAPVLVEFSNQETKLYPFQTMASHNRLTGCYYLLRMAPHLVRTTAILECESSAIDHSNSVIHIDGDESSCPTDAPFSDITFTKSKTKTKTAMI